MNNKETAKVKRKEKQIGQVFTPEFIVQNILDYCDYNGEIILKKHIIDNSCGDGAFLKIVVKKYIETAIKYGCKLEEIKSDLEFYIHGVDNDKIAYDACNKNLSSIANLYNIKDVKWDLYNKSSLSIKKFDGMMDYVVGNPPYVRVHNLDETYNEVKQYKFANGGMTDLYLAFFELGFNMLNESGKLCYITPSSWLNSVAASNMRKYILHEKNLVALIDLGHFQAFDNATTYTLISLFDKTYFDSTFSYFRYDGVARNRIFVDTLNLSECYINGYFYLADREHLADLKTIKTEKTPKYVSVKNGFATLADNIFIGDHVPQSKITIPIVKASTGKWTKCLFPYDTKGKLLPPDVALSDPEVRIYFEQNKEALLKGRPEYPSYYEFGRTQALLDVWKDKIAINSLLRTEKDLKIEEVKRGEGLYSGLYIVNDYNIPFEDIKEILITKDFATYVSLLKKYKSGGYYTFNSKDVEEYINYYITFKSEKTYDDKSTFFGQNFGIV